MSNRTEHKRQLQRGLSISSLLGLTWIFGALSIFKETEELFQYLFVICNSFQGLFIFVFFCLLQPKVRESWTACAKLCCRCCPSKTTSQENMRPSMVPLENPHEVSAQEIEKDVPNTTTTLDGDQNETSVSDNNNDDRRAVYRGRWFYQK